MVSIADIENTEESRLVTKDEELNRVLGGGIVAGSVILIGGEPGIGKSTLMLQLAVNMLDCPILYVSGEWFSKCPVELRLHSSVVHQPTPCM